MAYRDIPIPPGSSNVQQVQYDPDTGTLMVRFLRSPELPYFYEQVPGNVADGFTTSGLSAGKYLLLAVKDQYSFHR